MRNWQNIYSDPPYQRYCVKRDILVTGYSSFFVYKTACIGIYCGYGRMYQLIFDLKSLLL